MDRRTVGRGHRGAVRRLLRGGIAATPGPARCRVRARARAGEPALLPGRPRTAGVARDRAGGDVGGIPRPTGRRDRARGRGGGLGRPRRVRRWWRPRGGWASRTHEWGCFRRREFARVSGVGAVIVDGVVIVERHVRASRAAVYRFLTSGDRWATWQGIAATVNPTPGGALTITMPNGD